MLYYNLLPLSCILTLECGMHIFAALISFFSQFPGGVCPTMAPSITHVMLLANKLGYLQMYIYILC